MNTALANKGRPSEVFYLVAAEIVLALMMLALDRPLIRGDALAYFVWTASIGADFDMDLENQAAHLGELNTYMAIRNPQTGKYGNAFAWGQGIVLQPAFQLARLLDHWPAMRVNDEWFYALQRYPYIYSLIAMLQVNVMTMASLGIVHATARRLGIAALPAVWAGLTVILGTPLLYYSTIQPLYAHATATFVHTGALALFIFNLTSRPQLPARCWLLSGLLFGLATLVRWQLALSVVPCAGVLLLARERVGLTGLIAFIVGFLGLAWHVPFSFNWMFGSPFTTPMGEGFVDLPRFLGEVLFSNRRGFFLWSPIALLGILGLALGRRNQRLIYLALLGVVLAQIVINASVETWDGGESFGLRRLTETYPALALGMATLLSLDRVIWRNVGYVLSGSLAVYGVVLLFAALVFGYFSLPEMGYFSEQPEDNLTNVLAFFFSPPKFHLIWPMMEHHFGVWAWDMPGP
jgi:hypothetical protein